MLKKVGLVQCSSQLVLISVVNVGENSLGIFLEEVLLGECDGNADGGFVGVKIEIGVGLNVDVIDGFHIDGESLGESVEVDGVGVNEFKGSGGFEFMIDVGKADDDVMLVVGCTDGAKCVVDGFVIDHHAESEGKGLNAVQFAKERWFREGADEFGTIVGVNIALDGGRDFIKEVMSGFVNAEIVALSFGEEFDVMVIEGIDIIDDFITAGKGAGDMTVCCIFVMVIFEKGILGKLGLACMEMGFKFIGSDGFGEVVTLDDIAADGFECFALFLRLDTFRDDGNVEIVGDIDDDLKHAGVVAFAERVLDKVHIKLEGVNRECGEHVEGGVAVAKIIHFDTKAAFAEIVDGGDDLIGVLGVCGFGDFEGKFMRIKAVFHENIADGVYKMGIVHIHTGDIDGNGDRKTTGFLPCANLRGNLFPYIKVELFNKTVVFKEGYELAGGDETELGMNPADKCLCTGENGDVSANVKFRLVVDFELGILYGLMEGFDELLFKDFAFMKLVIINLDGLGVGVADHVHGHFRAIEASFNRDGAVDFCVNAHAETDAADGDIFAAEPA